MKTTSFILGLMFLTNISAIALENSSNRYTPNKNFTENASTLQRAQEDSTTLTVGGGLQTFKILVHQEGTKKDVLTNSVALLAKHVTKLDLLTNDEMLKRFNRIPADMVITITLAPDVKLITLDQFYAKHHINKEQQQLPFYIDEQKTDTTETVLICEEDLKDIQITDSYIKLVLQ